MLFKSEYRDTYATCEYDSHISVLPSKVVAHLDPTDIDLEASYECCMSLFKIHARSFYFASRYLDENDRRAFSALYAFCRLADDFADEIDIPPEAIEYELDALKDIVERMHQGEIFDHPVLRAFGDTMEKYKIPTKYLNELIEGVRMDTNLREIITVEELETYCYNVASTVGVMLCYIMRATDPNTIERAIDLGKALQITNILRDIDEDFQNGRIYLPLETRQQFRVTRDAFEKRKVDSNFKWLIKHHIAMANSYYTKAEIGIQDLPPGGAFTVKVASRVYAEIMNEIKKMDYDVFKKRAIVPKWKKLWIAYKLRREYYREKKSYESSKGNVVIEKSVAT
ncbi:MAG: phytoene/squalene synthase family protein [Candidatus Sifarchaeia archaeon]